MKTEEIRKLFEEFEKAVNHSDKLEYWSARDLQKLFKYDKWSNFEKVIEKAKESCDNAGENSTNHFADVGKMVPIGSNTERELSDIMLTRYACYLIAQNGNPRKEVISFAQSYFSVQTRIAENIEKRLLESERVKAREKLTQTEKQLSGILYERGVDGKGFGIIRSKGDQALFNLSTQALKNKLGVPNNRPVADFMPTIAIKAKDLAAEMTGINVQSKDLIGQSKIEKEHVDNNKAVRSMLTERGITPENLPPADDVKKIERRLKSEEKKITKQSKK